MLGKLTDPEIETMLREEIVGRIGCCLELRAYIVPIAYAYDGHFIYGYAADGEKLRIMRENPVVCFEVDRVDDAANWRSVIAWGIFEELREDEARNAVELLSSRLRIAESTAPPEAQRTYVTRRGRFGVAYRLRITGKSGIFERTSPDERRF